MLVRFLLPSTSAASLSLISTYRGISADRALARSKKRRPAQKKKKAPRRKARRAPRKVVRTRKRIQKKSSPRRAARRPARKKPAKRVTAKKKEVEKREKIVEETVPFAEKEFVRQTLLELTGVHFDDVESHPAFPLATQNLEWYMRCRNRDEITLSPYLNAAWKDKDGSIWLESLAIGDTIDWIELAYGDERATQSLDLDYSRLDDPEFQAEFERRYPIVLNRIRDFERIVSDVSRKHKARLEMRRAGARGMLVFTIAAKLEGPETAGQKALRSALEKNVSALREAHEAIEKV